MQRTHPTTVLCLVTTYLVLASWTWAGFLRTLSQGRDPHNQWRRQKPKIWRSPRLDGAKERQEDEVKSWNNSAAVLLPLISRSDSEYLYPNESLYCIFPQSSQGWTQVPLEALASQTRLIKTNNNNNSLRLLHYVACQWDVFVSPNKAADVDLQPVFMDSADRRWQIIYCRTVWWWA